MKFVDSSGQMWFLDWSYKVATSKTTKQPIVVTQCRLKMADRDRNDDIATANGHLFTTAITQKVGDTHSKDIARRVSLQRILKQSGVDYETRKAAWTAYLHRRQSAAVSLEPA